MQNNLVEYYFCGFLFASVLPLFVAIFKGMKRATWETLD